MVTLNTDVVLSQAAEVFAAVDSQLFDSSLTEVEAKIPGG